MMIFLIVVFVAWVAFNILAVVFSLDGEHHLLKSNLYSTLIFLPAILVVEIFILIGKLIMLFFKLPIIFESLKSFHKFMMQKPGDLFKFRIKLERKDGK